MVNMRIWKIAVKMGTTKCFTFGIANPNANGVPAAAKGCRRSRLPWKGLPMPIYPGKPPGAQHRFSFGIAEPNANGVPATAKGCRRSRLPWKTRVKNIGEHLMAQAEWFPRSRAVGRQSHT
jgi:hypothetical protein